MTMQRETSLEPPILRSSDPKPDRRSLLLTCTPTRLRNKYNAKLGLYSVFQDANELSGQEFTRLSSRKRKREKDSEACDMVNKFCVFMLRISFLFLLLFPVSAHPSNFSSFREFLIVAD